MIIFLQEIKSGTNFYEMEVLEKVNKYFSDEELKLDLEDIDWLENCLYYNEAEDYICVHVGIKLYDNNEIICLSKMM